MTLQEALKSLAPAVGDGKLLPASLYVSLKSGVLHVSDNQQFARVALDVLTTPNADFCVRYDALVKAVNRDGALLTVESDTGNVFVKYKPRGSVKLRPLIEDIVPVPEVQEGRQLVPLGPDFVDMLKVLMKFVGPPDGQVWTQGIHIGPDFCFAASSRSACLKTWETTMPNAIALPIWAAQFILAQSTPPVSLNDCDTLLEFKWANGLVLHTKLLSQGAPENVYGFVQAMPDAEGTVPDGFKLAVERIKEHGATTFRVGEGKVFNITETVEVEEEVDMQGPIRLWSCDTMLTALEYATKLDLSGAHGVWSSPEGYKGYIGGMSG